MAGPAGLTAHDKRFIFLELLCNVSEFGGVINKFMEVQVPAILLWLLGVPLPVILLLVLFWH